jgi:hypothetical protein
MLYIATARDVALRRTTALSVEEVEPGRRAIQRWFSGRNIRYVGAYTGCGWGFPSVISEQPVEYYEGLFDDTQDREKDLASVRALFGLIAELLPWNQIVEMLLVWAGDEHKRPVGTIKAQFGELQPEKFFFMEHFLYSIT